MIVSITLYKLNDVLVSKSFENMEDFKNFIEKNDYNYLTQVAFDELDLNNPIRRYSKKILVKNTYQGKTQDIYFYVYNSYRSCYQDFIKSSHFKYLAALKTKRGILSDFNVVREMVILDVLNPSFMQSFDDRSYIQIIW